MQIKFHLILTLVYLSMSPSCHTATQWQNLKKIQDLTGEELSQDTSALAQLCDSFAKCKVILAPDIFFPNHWLCQTEAGALEHWQVDLAKE